MKKPSSFCLRVHVPFFSIRTVIYKVSNFTRSELRQKPNQTEAVKIDKFLDVMVVNQSQTTIFQLYTNVTAHSCLGSIAISILTCPSKRPFLQSF